MIELPTPYQQYIHQSKYARWREDLGRRENWEETVDRFMEQMDRQLNKKKASWPSEVRDELRQGILNDDVLPSMRALMTAGKALERDNVAGYNCAYVIINRPRVWAEILYILCCGTGVGYSVERQEITKLPVVPELTRSDRVIYVRDSKIGWAEALESIIDSLYLGEIPSWDTSEVRPAGALLKTFGGRASGPEPLEDLFEHIVATFIRASGRKLDSEECHSITCKVGDIVVVGGVRRSALLALFNPSDERMLNAKTGAWYDDPSREHYALANNSAAWTEKPDMERFLDKWFTLVKGKSGEPGIFNREAAQSRAQAIGREPREFGVNPCGEIILRDRQFCNLSSVIVREGDKPKDIERKVRLATILGTIQASFTDFRFLSDSWKKNCEEEALLGVSLDGVQDNRFTNVRANTQSLAYLLNRWKGVYRHTNSEWADLLGINQAAAGTCDKPSGNSSQKTNAASGLHTRWSPYYVRRTRGNKNDPVSQVVYMSGVSTEDEIRHPEQTFVFSWPIKSPDVAITRDDVTAVEQLEHWLLYSEFWCEHNPSITVYVKDHEWLEVGAWVYKHFDRMVGVTFLPATDHVYKQAPYEEITQERYEALMKDMPESIDWSLLSAYESSDMTEGAKELACVSGSCEAA